MELDLATGILRDTASVLYALLPHTNTQTLCLFPVLSSLCCLFFFFFFFFWHRVLFPVFSFLPCPQLLVLFSHWTQTVVFRA